MNNTNMTDGIYMELFSVQEGVRYNVKIINLLDMTTVLTQGLVSGITELCKIEEET